jgi:VanZ family protein
MHATVNNSISPSQTAIATCLTRLLQRTEPWRCTLLACLIAITWLAFTERPPKLTEATWDKLNHVFAFAVLSICAWRSVPRISQWWRIIGLLVYGIGIEVVQGTLPHRSASGLDILADTIGLMIGESCRWLISKLTDQGLFSKKVISK